MRLPRPAMALALGGLCSTLACAPATKPAEAPVDEAPSSPPEVPPSPSADAAPVEAPALPTAEELTLERHRALALAALRQSEATPNRLGVRAVLLARTSDVPWLLAVENQSEHPVEVLADPALLEFDVETPEEDVVEAPVKGRAAAKKKSDRVTCRAGSRPKGDENSTWVKIEPGSLLTYSFDPRPLCEKEGSLVRGKLVTARFGFPIETRKVWSKGRSETVTNELEAPFLARRVSESSEVVPVKNLELAPFTLDETYPFDELAAIPLTAAEREEAARRGGLPLALSIRPLGTVADADETVVSVTLRNRSDKSLRLFYRREHLVYEIEGPLGPATCVMQPSDRAPEANAYDTLSPGESISLATRLAEACPLGTFDRPGPYSVSVRLEAHHSGREVGLDAFVGRIPSTAPARLIVKSAKPGGRIVPVMRLVPPRLPRTPTATPEGSPDAAPVQDAPDTPAVEPPSE